MFPLKRRRKFARISKEGLTANVVIKDNNYTAIVKDISASGCNISLDDKSVVISDTDIVTVSFVLNEIDFTFKASKVRENSFKFIFEDAELQATLNGVILTEYFKDTPELIPVDKALK